MHRFVAVLLVSIGIITVQALSVFAEERKSLEELLVEKGTITQEEAASVQGRKLSKWLDRLTFYGDFRLRHESVMADSDTPSANIDRHRERFRLRLTSELKIDNFLVGVQLASGEGQQVSTNQSFDNLFSQKALWIQLAYLRWNATPWLAITGGKMPNPFYRTFWSEIVWDDDLTPEGAAENLTFKATDMFTLFVNAGQLVLDEDGGDNNDQWLFGEQAGVQVGLTKSTKATLAGAFYNFYNATRGNLGQVVVQDGNTRVPVSAVPAIPNCPTPLRATDVPGVTCASPGLQRATAATPTTLANAYRVLDISAELTTMIGTLPFAIEGDYVKNLADTTSDKDTGYQAGVRLGKASDADTWEIAYVYRLLETDATLADINDSDFGNNGGTNRKGHIAWVSYSPTKYMVWRVKDSITKTEDETLSPGKKDINRLQVDLLVKF